MNKIHFLYDNKVYNKYETCKEKYDWTLAFQMIFDFFHNKHSMQGWKEEKCYT